MPILWPFLCIAQILTWVPQQGSTGMDKLKMSKMKAQIAAVLVSLHPNSTLHHCFSSGAIALQIVFNDG